MDQIKTRQKIILDNKYELRDYGNGIPCNTLVNEYEKFISVEDLHKFINKREEFSKTLEDGEFSEEQKWIIGTSELLHFIGIKKPYRVRAGK